MTPPARLLVVDDNQAFREALRRNLELGGHSVDQAGDAREALDRLAAEKPDVVITDLAMGHPTEGLDLITEVRRIHPHLPVIMVSAVGTFDEGAEAMRRGADRVLGKQRIDEQIGDLHAAIAEAVGRAGALREIRAGLDAILAGAEADPRAAVASLDALLGREGIPPSLKIEIHEHRLVLADPAAARAEARDLTSAAADGGDPARAASGVEADLTALLPAFASLDAETRSNLVTAELLYRRQEERAGGADFARSVSFSYCFAVENEIKLRLRRPLGRLLSAKSTRPLIEREMLEGGGTKLSMFYQQHLLRVLRELQAEVTLDNFRHVLNRIVAQGPAWRPDGLKAVGIALLCFGRDYTFRRMRDEVRIGNPLGLNGLDSDHAARLAALLINLQHDRNPYIHPETPPTARLSRIRQTSFDGLSMMVDIR